MQSCTTPCRSQKLSLRVENYNRDEKLPFIERVLGLRLEHGIDLSGFSNRFGFDLAERYRRELNDLIANGLVELSSRFQLTQ